MPPRKRGRPVAAEAPQPEPESEAAASDDENASNQSDQDHPSDPDPDPDPDQESGQRETEQPDFKFFNTTFSTFRASPLYTAQNALTPAGLQTLSRRLRDTLVGDVVRGVQVGLEGDATLGRLGALERVEWRECSLGTLLPTLADTEAEAEAEAEGGAGNEGRRRRGGGIRRGRAREPRPRKAPRLLCLELEYERATFHALMLPSLDDRAQEEMESGDGDEPSGLRKPPSWTQTIAGSGDQVRVHDEEDANKNEDFAHFPLLLTRMPAPLRAVLVDFLSTTFDCRISPLHLGTRTLVRSWERWIEESGVTRTSSRRRVLNKDVALTLGFHLAQPQAPSATTMATSGASAPNEQQHSDPPAPPLGLKTIDVIVPADEVHRFLRVGQKPTILPSSHTNNRKNLKRPAADPASREEERLRRRKRGGGRDEEGWAWREAIAHPTPEHADEQDRNRHDTETFPQPFTDALAAYLSHHLALDIHHPGVRVTRVVCDAFALSEGRVKVFAPRGDGAGDGDGAAAVETFVRDLVRRAKGREWGSAALRLANLKVVA